MLSRKVLNLLRWVFSFPAMLATLLAGQVFYAARQFKVDPDMWWHIQAGQDILRTHRFPTIDSYSFTVAGSPWIAYEWLGEILLGWAARAGGLVALSALLIALSSMFMLGVYCLAAKRSGNCKAALVASMAICSMAFVSLNMRPQMFGYLCMVLLLLVLESFRRGTSWPIWWLPVVFLLWVNTHGTFLLGLGVLVTYLLSGLKRFELGSIVAAEWNRAQRLQLETVLLLSLVVLPLTPYGTQLAASPFPMAFRQPLNLSSINEWRPMPFDLLPGKMFLAFIAAFVVLQVFFRFSWRLEEFVLVLGSAVMACLHVRFAMLFLVFFTPLFATMLARWLPPYKRATDQYLFNAVLMAVVVVAMVHYRPTSEFLEDRVSEAFPVNAVHYLDRHAVPGPVYNSYGFGGYLIASGHKVFVDGRGDIYERGGILSDHLSLLQLKPGALSILDRYGIQSCLIDPKESLAAALLVSPEWNRVYADNNSVLFVRASGVSSASEHLLP